ncbi:hypothetical protein [uncultured Kocuria sp.]|uniref:hypothetical protein n=1 Tax=uncultured Kocuria sp. TaxID=259305 RepID=UPI002594F8B8|nr:hypothetical protein [uncultured Kocuria sp.]MCT1368410.1 hypothetical protein [Rothia sp. p3-SID1597]
MGLLDNLRETATNLVETRYGYKPGERRGLLNELEYVRESIADLQLAKEDAGWTRLIEQTSREFTREGVGRNAELCRVLAIANPLIKRGLAVRASFVWGQGLGITAKATGENGTQDINTVVQEFLDDPGNRRAFTGHQARLDAETAIGTDGNKLLALFTDARTGRVQVRTIPFDEVTNILTNPQDSTEPWFYYRTWTETSIQAGRTATVERKAYYPALGYRPVVRNRTIDDVEVMWDTPVYHVKDNGLDGWAWGIGDAYASIPWVRTYGAYLDDWAKLMSALARISFRISGKDRHGVMAARKAMQDAMAAPVAGGAIAAANADIEAVPKSGASIDAESGKPLAVMVAAGLGIPVTLLMGDPGTTGARAVAETLDQPMRLEFESRRELWTEAHRAILNHVIDSAVLAPQGPLKGTVSQDGNRQTVNLAGDTERTLVFEWPRLDELGEKDAIDAITAADSTGKIPPEVIARLLLRALKVRDVDEVIDDMTDDNGNFIPPDASTGDALIQAYHQGATH